MDPLRAHWARLTALCAATVAGAFALPFLAGPPPDLQENRALAPPPDLRRAGDPRTSSAGIYPLSQAPEDETRSP